MTTVIIDGFKLNSENPVFHKKLSGIVLDEVSDDSKLLENLKSALAKSDFIAIFVVKGGSLVH